MEISQSIALNNPSVLIANRIDALGLKLNQQLQAIVINSSKQTLTISLQINQTNKTILVESNLPIKTQKDQKLQLEITKLTPTPEFKVLSSQNEIKPGDAFLAQHPTKQLYLNSLILRQIVTPTASNNPTLQQTQNAYPSSDSIIALTKGQSNHLNNYIPGQLFNATIIDVKNNTLHIQLSANKTFPEHSALDNKQNHPSSTLTLAFNKYSSFESQALQKGQIIRLEMLTNGSQAEFKLLFNDALQQQKILETLRRNLPIHEQPSILFNQIINNLHVINTHESIPDTLKRLASEILANLFDNKNLVNPEQLKKMINNSGLFLEAKLAQLIEKNAVNTQTDLKNQLLKLLNELETAQARKINPNNADLLKLMQQKTENTLAGIILHQLASLPTEEGPRQIWTLELPFLYKEIANTVHIEINQKQTHKNQDKHNNWAVTLTLTPPKLGTIYCKIYCIDNTCNTRFWSESQKVVNKISHHLEFLKDQFEKSGINPGHMSAHAGIPKIENHNPFRIHNLINQKI